MSRKRTTSSTTAAMLNNEGVSYMLRGDYETASTRLSESLTMIKTMIRGCTSQCSSCSRNYAGETPFTCAFTQGIHNLPNEAFMFQQPIVILGSCTVPSFQELSRVMSYSVMYNLALSFHKRALLTTEATLREAYLKQALRLYAHAKDIWSTAPQQGEGSLGVYHTLALTNNMGHVSQLMSDGNSSANQYFEYMLRLIMRISQTDTGREALCHDKNMEGFLSNAMSRETSSSAPAA